MSRNKFHMHMINGLTIYRILAAPILLFLIINDQQDWFKWLLLFSFLTDAIDGYLARRFKTESIKGARLDSIGDDLTILAAAVGMLQWNYSFLWEYRGWLTALWILLMIEVTLALIRYSKMTAFHTYGAKLSAILQATFLCSFFLLGEPLIFIFYMTIIITGLALIEEIVLILTLKHYRCNVKGLYWVHRR